MVTVTNRAQRITESAEKIESPFVLDPTLCLYSPQDNVDSLTHPRIASWLDFMRDGYEPKLPEAKRRVLLFMPCTKTKPYPFSSEHKAINQRLADEGFRPTARLDLPLSPGKRLRQMRLIAALDRLQGKSARVVDPETGRPGATLSEALDPQRAAIADFADEGGMRRSLALAPLLATVFPMVLPPEATGGLGVVLLNSNAETHFSFTNALGFMPREQEAALAALLDADPDGIYLVALHHHVVEYPKPAKALSERIGTALVNGSWFVRRLSRFADRVVVMHGHRHIDWIGRCGPLVIISAPSPVMNAKDTGTTAFYVHVIGRTAAGRIALHAPRRIEIEGDAQADA